MYAFRKNILIGFLSALGFSLHSNTLVQAHGCMNFPNPRGSLTNRSTFIFNSIDTKAPVDWLPHFPAGSRNPLPGSGHRSQVIAAGKQGWQIYNPFLETFPWRSGVCGDMLPPSTQHHRIGGKYYYKGKIVETYESGGIISAGLSISAHHNGFIQLHICDIDKCPTPDISFRCFRTKGACRELLRAPNSVCDSGESARCGPIDRNFKGRWYFPCTKFPKNDAAMERFGRGISETILYKIPDHLACEHCVLQFFWSSAHNCNPPGVIQYYNGLDKPKVWGSCYSQGGGMGGVTRVQKDCSKHRFPEEYLSCADIRILRK